LESGNKVTIDGLKANILALLEAVRIQRDKTSEK